MIVYLYRRSNVRPTPYGLARLASHRPTENPLHLSTQFLHYFALKFCHPELISGSFLLTKPVLSQCNKVQQSAILFLLTN